MSALSELADLIEESAREEWDRVLIRREFREGEPTSAGSSWWDGRQALYREIVAQLRLADRDGPPGRSPSPPTGGARP